MITPSTTRAIARDAEPSTVRVQAIVCAAQASGSGVVVRNGYVVTNAHVVAGARNGAVAVATVDGDRAVATVVLFDTVAPRLLGFGEPSRFTF